MEKLLLGIQVSVVGISVTVIALILLSWITSFTSKVLAEKEIAPAQIQINNPPLKKENTGITSELLAVITAAVASTFEAGSKYKITTIKRVDYDLSPNWSRKGIAK